MKALLKKITKILKSKKIRKAWYRAVSIIAAVVVFVTTYVLILPAITLESSAAVCGLEAHQHSDDCYEDKLVCGEEESEGHHHDDECYTVSRELVCGIEEHRHDDVCFDEDGNLVCQEQEHAHTDDCYQEDRELTCRKAESEGHHHDRSCYERVLVCGKEAHIHSDRCYLKDDKDASNADGVDTVGEEKTDAEPEIAEPENAEPETAEPEKAEPEKTEAGTAEPEIAEPEKAEESLPEIESGTKIPQLDPVNMEAMLNKHTDMYYFHAEDGEELPADSMEIEDWQKVKDDTELCADDFVRAYLAYTIPAGSLNETNPVARYRLPENIRLTDKQIKAFNQNENGIAAAYSKSSAEYKKYLGAEAVEGDRRPGEMLNDGGQEYISAVVRAENVYKNDKYLGQDLIFTFAPYTVEKNQDIYDANGNTVKAGQNVTGWFACDFNMSQVEWTVDKNNFNTGDNAEEKENAEKAAVKTVEKTAEVIFVAEDKKEDIKEISRRLKLVEQDKEVTLEKEPEKELEKEPEKEPEKELEKEPEKEPEKEQEQEYESGTLTSDGGQRSDPTSQYFAKRGVEPIDPTTDDQTINLAEFVTDATIEIEGRTYGAGETWPVREDVDYALKLTFKEKGSRQFPRGGEEMVMVPAELGGMALVPGQSGTFDIPMGLYGVVTGNQWWVDSDGLLHIKFGDDPDDLLTRSNNTYIKLSFNVDFHGTEGEILFNDTVIRDWEAKTDTDISVTKNGHYNASTGKMEYTVVVTSTGHTTNIKVTDTFATNNLLTLDQSSITISPDKELAETGNYTGSDGFTRVIKEMTHGEKVTITYTADVNESALGPNGLVKGDDGKNNIVVEDDQEDKDEKTNIVHEIKFSDLDKAAVSQTETSDGKILMSWEITANTERRASLVGSTITDRIDLASKDIMKYAKADGKVQLHVTGTDGAGNTYSRTIEVTPDDSQGQESWTWTVENIGEAEGTPLSYSITYDTIAEKQTNNVAVKNDAENSSGGSDTGVGVVPGTDPGGDTPPSIVTEKAATAVTPEYIDWAIVINVPEEGFPDGLTVKDYIPRGKAEYDENNYGFADRLAGAPTVSGLTGTETFKWKVVDDYGDHFYRNGENYAAQTLTIDFYESYESEAQNDPGLGAGPRTITISLRTQNDQMWIDYAMAQGTGDPIYKHTNTGKVNDTDITAYAIPLKPALEKEHRYTSEKDGLPVYEYMITLSNVTELPVVIEDTFNSEFLEFYRIGVDGWEPFDYIAAAEQKYQLNNGVVGYAATGDQTGPGKITITATDLPRKENGSFYEYYRIYYCLKVKDETALADLKNQAIKNGGKYTLTNTAVWEGLPDECNVDYEVKVVSKDGYFATNNTEERKFTFVIDVNPAGFDLSDGGTVELTDQHTKNLSVDYSSVKIYKIPTEESIADVKAAAQNNQLQSEWLCTSGSIPWNFVGNNGTFTLEDQTHYVIVYDAIVIGSGKQEFSNIADLEGFIAIKEEERTYSSGSAAGGDIWEIKLLKYKDGLTSNGLQGATFQLFKGTGEYYEETDGTNTWQTEYKEPMKYGDTASTRQRDLVGKDITFTTGSDGPDGPAGLVTIKLDEVNDGNELEGGVHYYLKEIESPAGYQIDSSTEYWSFTLTTDPDEVNYGDENRRDEYGNLQWVYFYYNDILKMANTETTEPLDVVVNKSWFDKNGYPITGDNLDETLVAKVQLMRKTDNGDYVPVKVEQGSDGPVITEVPASTEESQAHLTKENNWSYTWNDLPRVETGGDQGNEVVHRYAYKIEEVKVDGYVVSVSETETETVKTYALNNYKTPDDKTTEVTVNKKWQDAEGQEIDGTTERLPSDIRFELYRAVSTTPFTRVPTSGGNLYVIANDPYLVDNTASEGDADYGLYKLLKSESWKATFNNLPEVETTDGKTYYYAYYVKEIPLTGYTTSYISDGTVRTIVNREPQNENIDIGLEKKWQSGTNTTPPPGASATFTVHQQKAEATSGGSGQGDLTVNLVDSNEERIASVMASDGNQLLLSGYHFTDWHEGSEIWAEIKYKRRYGSMSAGQLVEDADGNARNVSITVDKSLMAIENVITFILVDKTKDDFLNLPVLSNTSGGGLPSYSEYEDTGSVRTVVLPTADGKWSTTIRDLIRQDAEGNLYRYYITEDSCSPMDESVTFRDQNGNAIKDESKTEASTKPLDENVRKVEVTNIYETEDFIFTKEWHDIGDNVDPDWHGDIRVFVQRKIGNGTPEAVGKYTIHKENAAFVISKDESSPEAPDLVNDTGFTFKISDLPKKGTIGNVTGEYVYFVTEEIVSGYRDAEYKNPSVSSTEGETTWIPSSDYALNNGKIINRPENSVELPHTGGPGTMLIHLLGIMLTGLAVVCLVYKERKKTS